MRYPVEIELTDYCGLKCEGCINPYLKNKDFMSFENFNYLLGYLYKNKEQILYINFSGIGDVFLHPEFSDFINLFCKKFSGEKIDILIPSKGNFYNGDTINSLKKIVDNGFGLNISVGFFSLSEKNHNKIVGFNLFRKSLNFMKTLKLNQIPFSIELASTNANEKKYLKKLASIFDVGYSFQGIHNFGGYFNEKDTISYNQCSFDTDNNYILDNFYCPFIPFITKDLKIYPCSISGKQSNFFYGYLIKESTFNSTYINLVYSIKSFLGSGTKCSNCTIYKISKGLKK